jgi:holo-[acyl-carrier protein] synthase
MILGIGSDIIDIRRIEAVIARHGERFISRVFTPVEQQKALRRTEKIRAATLAKRFAAKEAAAKALGTGFRRGVFFSDLGVVNLPGGQPSLHMTGGAAARLKVAVGAHTLAAGASVGAKVEYETIILDAPWQRRKGLRYTVAQGLQLLMLEQASPKRSGLGAFAVAAPPRVAFDEESFIVTSTADGTAASGFAAASTKGAALAALADHLKAHPEDRGQLQVVPASELAPTP